MTIWIAVYEYDAILGYLNLDYVKDKNYSQAIEKEYPTWHYAKYNILDDLTSLQTGMIKRTLQFI